MNDSNITNDFSRRFVDEINTIPNLIPQAKVGFIAKYECLRVYPTFGGKDVNEWMDGSREVELPYQIAIKNKHSGRASELLWLIYEKLTDRNLEIPSKNNSYEFVGLEVATPSLNDVDKEGWYIYLLDFTATIIIENKMED